MKVGDRVSPAKPGGPPWTEGIVESIHEEPLRSGMRIGVRLTEAALGYRDGVAFFRDDELVVVG